jgi:hypothetical protein
MVEKEMIQAHIRLLEVGVEQEQLVVIQQIMYRVLVAQD